MEKSPTETLPPDAVTISDESARTAKSASEFLPPDRLLSRAQVEQHFGISKRFLEVAAVRGGGPRFARIGRSVRYQVSELRRWIEENSVSSTSQEVSQ